MANEKPLELGKFWTISNLLSISRAFIVIPIMYLILTGGSVLWLVTWVAAGVTTDWLDGKVARWTNTVSGWGKVLDPLADKIAAIGIVTALAWIGQVPMWLLAIIASRDVLIMVGGALFARKLGEVPMSIWTGKVTVTVLSILVLGAALRVHPAVLDVLTNITASMFVYSFTIYVLRALYYLWKKQDGAFWLVLDDFANEMVVALLGFFYVLSTAPLFEAFFPLFHYVTAIWFVVALLCGWIAYHRRKYHYYPTYLHLPSLVAVILCFYTFLEPDPDIINAAQWILITAIGMVALFFIPGSMRHFPFYEMPPSTPNVMPNERSDSEESGAL